MKKFNLFILFVSVLLLLTVVNCNGQPKNNYEIGSNTVTGTAHYHFFLEKKSASPYKLTQGMDYLDANGNGIPEVGDTIHPIGTSTTPLFTVNNLINDGSEYKVGVVAENSAGFYGGMGTNTGNVGTVPGVPAGVIFRKK